MKDNILWLTVQAANVSKRLDVYVAGELPELSRSHVQNLIAEGFVYVNDRKVKANYKVQTEDRIAIELPEPKPAEIIAEKIPLAVLYEDEAVIVINKARGMVVHPAAGNHSGTLVNALLEHCENLSGINGIIRPGIVHRLDKETSGVMVAAKNDHAHLKLAEQIKNRTAVRQYVAVVHGNIAEPAGTINAPIGRHKTDRQKMAVVFSGSKEAVTNFMVLERFGNYTLIKCKLLTGRTHQIRVHMDYIKHPVVGDPKYGPAKAHFNIQGQALHACELSFKHPVTGVDMEFFALLPEDMSKILAELRKNRAGE